MKHAIKVRKTEVDKAVNLPPERQLDIFYAEYDKASNKPEVVINFFMDSEYGQPAKAMVLEAIANPHWFSENEEEAFGEQTITAVHKWVYSNLMSVFEIAKYFGNSYPLTEQLCEEVKKNDNVSWLVVERVLGLQIDFSLSVLFINSLNESVFTPDFVDEVINFLKHGSGWVKSPEVVSALAKRVQVHLGMDETIPTSWVIKALQ